MKNLMLLTFTMIMSAQALAQTSMTRVVETPSKKSFEIRIEPQWLLLKELSLDFQFRLSDKFTLGPTVGIMNKGEGVFYGSKVSKRLFMDDRTDRTSYGLRAAYYFNGFDRRSSFISLFGRQGQNEVTSSGNTFSSRVETGKFKETVAGVTGGYRWVWGLLTMNISGGLANYSHPKAVDMTDDSGAKSTYALDDEKLTYVIDAGIGLMF